ncbi:hypothetical protein SAMN05421749_10481 [Acinetobacter marinus]|uniref:BD-FAE-like domain-containing protein n=1 Tax=Acinetobacter marinus TaxID=281375 RepID=A0A1G6KKF5_9GAMM|nr:subtype B tannase [Acinetobacter marinus]SDC31015.1 hypothetical protein SAMN05421749_10481 [Acinetobacter marinus]
MTSHQKHPIPFKLSLLCLSTALLGSACQSTIHETANIKTSSPQSSQQSSKSTDVLRFDSSKYTTQTLEVDGKNIQVRAYENISYVRKPVEPDYQVMNIYIPKAYFQGQSINGFNAQTAPIFFPNQVGGYMPAKPATAKPSEQGPDAGKASTVAQALAHGFIVASAGARGRTLQSNGQYTGKAPAAIVDLKAAVRYLRFNDDVMLGNGWQVISNGTSAGGALSALLGASGDSKDYAPYLEALGAAKGSDRIFAVSAYCPITILEHADAAYEWQFNGINAYKKMSINMLDYKVERKLTPGTLSTAEQQVSNDLKAQFPDYLNQLKLHTTFKQPLILGQDGQGTFLKLVQSYVQQSAQKAYQQGANITTDMGFEKSGSTVVLKDYQKYLSNYMGRQKTPPAFDALDLSSGENQLFGTASIDQRHFTVYAMQHNQKSDAQMADAQTIQLMNPMAYIDQPDAQTAVHWRIRQGAKDADTSLAIPVILATKLENSGKSVDFEVPWAQGHGGDYDLEELFAWMKRVSTITAHHQQ